MTVLAWDQIGERRYETGVDRGVLYVPDGDAVPWNGLVSVNESPEGGTLSSYFFDGKKYLDVYSGQDYKAVLEAFTYPDEFAQFDGLATVESGMFATYQPRSTFGLSYRTRVGLDTDPNAGYKIHLIYNATAVPAAKNYSTIDDSADVLNMQWDIYAVPMEVPGFKPTAHIVIDSTQIDDPFLLQIIEEMLYGYEDGEAYLPTPYELASLIGSWSGIVITDNGDGTWTAVGDDRLVDLITSEEFVIIYANAVYPDPDYFTISSSLT